MRKGNRRESIHATRSGAGENRRHGNAQKPLPWKPDTLAARGKRPRHAGRRWFRVLPVPVPKPGGAPLSDRNGQPGRLRVTVSATGKLAPVNEVEVGSELSGTIEAVFVDYNDRVKKARCSLV